MQRQVARRVPEGAESATNRSRLPKRPRVVSTALKGVRADVVVIWGSRTRPRTRSHNVPKRGVGRQERRGRATCPAPRLGLMQ